MAWFDAVTWPRVSVLAGIGTAPGGSVCVVDSGVVGTNVTGGPNMVEIGNTTAGGRGNVRSVSIQDVGRPSEIDSASPASCTIVLNNGSGDYDFSNPGGLYDIEIGAPIQVAAEHPAGMFYPLFTGEIADLSVDAGIDPTATFTCVDGLEKLGRAYLPLEQVPIFAGDLTGRRISNLADRADWPFDKRALDDGNNTLAGTLLGGSALDLMQQTERAEFGLLFVAPDGVLIFYDRYRTTFANRSVMVQAAFVDTPGGPSVTTLELARSRERIYNRAAITRQPLAGVEDDEPIEQVADDAASQATHGVLAFPGQAGELLATNTDALAMAQGLVGRFKDPANRIREVQINPLNPTYTNVWATILPLRLLDRISVSHDYGPNTIAGELLIQQISIDIRAAPPAWDLRLVTSPAPAAVSDVCFVEAGLVGTHKVSW